MIDVKQTVVGAQWTDSDGTVYRVVSLVKNSAGETVSVESVSVSSPPV